MKPPAMLRAVHTTPPMMRAATMPLEPLSPAATITMLARMSVMRVMPLTGLVPTMAMALAATVVKRKQMTATTSSAMTVKRTLPAITSHIKKAATAMSVMMSPKEMVFMDRSVWVRSAFSCVPACLPPSSRPARERAPTIMLRLLIMPIMPAMAIPPMPMLLA